MAAVPPTSSSPTTLTAGVQQPHHLKGIVNTNDDPHRCAGCSDFMQDLDHVAVNDCCGRGVCESCVNAERQLKHCPQCKTPENRIWKKIVACLKKHSKKGQPWAQVRLAGLYCGGDDIRQSLSEALHWYRQAAKRGHPSAMRILGKWLLRGTGGFSVDLHQAQEHFEAALKASKTACVNSDVACRGGLVEIAECHYEAEAFEKAKAILFPLAEEGLSEAQVLLGHVLLDCEEGLSYREVQNNYSSALPWFSSAAFALEGEKSALGNAEHGAMCCCDVLHKYAQAKFWARIVKKTLRHPRMNGEARIARVKKLVDIQRKLRAVRDVCGGCGAEFEGKERKFCRACRAYCYCSRECQKMHWNRKERGHREDCKGASELKQKMKEKKKTEAIKASESK